MARIKMSTMECSIINTRMEHGMMVILTDQQLIAEGRPLSVNGTHSVKFAFAAAGAFFITLRLE